jgi:hypothetical protein
MTPVLLGLPSKRTLPVETGATVEDVASRVGAGRHDRAAGVGLKLSKLIFWN